MKTRSGWTRLVVVVVFTGSGAMAANAIIEKLITLRGRRDEAVRRATAQIDATYMRELEKLPGQAKKVGDESNAARIRTEIQSLGEDPRPAEVKPAKQDLAAILMAGSWEWQTGSSYDEEMKSCGKIRFLEDGELSVGGRVS